MGQGIASLKDRGIIHHNKSMIRMLLMLFFNVCLKFIHIISKSSPINKNVETEAEFYGNAKFCLEGKLIVTKFKTSSYIQVHQVLT